MDVKDLPKEQGNMTFWRWEYWGFSSLFALHYTGDHTVYTAFPHRGAKEDTRVFVRSPPIVKEKVIISNYLKLDTRETSNVSIQHRSFNLSLKYSLRKKNLMPYYSPWTMQLVLSIFFEFLIIFIVFHKEVNFLPSILES